MLQHSGAPRLQNRHEETELLGDAPAPVDVGGEASRVGEGHTLVQDLEDDKSYRPDVDLFSIVALLAGHVALHRRVRQGRPQQLRGQARELVLQQAGLAEVDDLDQLLLGVLPAGLDHQVVRF